MQKFLLNTGVLSLILAILSATPIPAPVYAQPVPAQQPVPKPIHGKGRIAPKNLAALKELDKQRNGDRVFKLPKATAATYDCRALGLVPPIVDQAQCGSCWDFSGTSICTSAFIKQGWGKNDGSFALSEQYTLDCGQNGGCNGDDNTTVTAWCKSTGLPLTSVYGPYKAQAGRCSYSSSMTLYKISDWGFADGGQGNGVTDTQLIKNAIVAYGPVGCAVAAGGTPFWDNGTTTDTGTSNSIDHDVVIVGWDDTHANGDGTTGAWIMRNSWGTSWGVTCTNSANPNPVEAGYAWAKYGADQLGTETIYVIAPPSTSPVPSTAPAINSNLAISGMPTTTINYQITATNTPTSYNATGLPGGLTVNTTTGVISGVLTTPGIFTIQVSATNTVGTGTANLVLTVSPNPSPGTIPAVTSSLAVNASTTAAFSYQITASNNPTVYGCIGLPAGLTASTTGLISGTATTVGTYNVVLLAVNGSGVGTATLVLTVSTAPPLNPVQLTLSPDQVQTVITESGVITIRKEMSLRELGDAINKCVTPPQATPVKTPCPCDKSSTSPMVPVPANGKTLEQRLDELERSNKAILDALLPKDK